MRFIVLAYINDLSAEVMHTHTHPSCLSCVIRNWWRQDRHLSFIYMTCISKVNCTLIMIEYKCPLLKRKTDQEINLIHFVHESLGFSERSENTKLIINAHKRFFLRYCLLHYHNILSKWIRLKLDCKKLYTYEINLTFSCMVLWGKERVI